MVNGKNDFAPVTNLPIYLSKMHETMTLAMAMAVERPKGPIKDSKCARVCRSLLDP